MSGFVCSFKRAKHLCAYIEKRERRRTVKVKGRWVEGRRQVRGYPGNRYVYRPRKWVLYKVPRQRVVTWTDEVRCDAPRLGARYGKFQRVCAKHAQAIAAEQVKEARGERATAAHALGKAKEAVAAAQAEQDALQKKLRSRRTS